MLKELHLQKVGPASHFDIRQQRYQLYLDGDLTLQGLEKKAPLIARAIKKQQQAIF
jgi:hypothetical protein